MRTTLTLDPDVAALLDEVRNRGGLSLKAAVNRALRLGLTQLARPATGQAEAYRTPAADTGRLLVPDVTCVARVLDFLEAVEDEAG
jgi:hypothetical protein